MTSEPVLADPASGPAAGWAIDPAKVRWLAEWVVAAPDAERLITHAPFTGRPAASLPLSTPADVQTAVARARAAQRSWAQRSLRDRAAVLLRLHDLVLQRQGEGIDLLQTETGKARLHAYEEIADVAINCRWYARQAHRLLADRRRPGLVPGLTRVREVRHAKGVIGVIAPWNYPLTLAVSDSVPALLAGNAVLLKPDNQTAVIALWAASLLTEAGLPEHLFQVVLGDGPVIGTAVVDSCDHVAFTGSTATGRSVAQRAAGRLVGASLELGGKNAVYVAEDADLGRAAEALIRDCFGNAGQVCISMERMILHERIADAFLDRFTDRVRHLRLGPAMDFSCDVGSLISQSQLQRVQGHVQDAVDRGARVLAGGRARPDLGPYFFEPTVLEGVTPQAQCYANETFGPVVSVYRVGSDGAALTLANGTDFGLNASIWTGDLRRGVRLARQVQAGTVCVNEAYTATWGSVAAPMGGRKDSGLGRRHGAEGLLRYTEVQTIAAQRVGLGLAYAQGGARFAAMFTGALKVARRTGLPWP
jgi:succinate-semialdehyde dehydrogenase / glutarate-semialdehyde dehydrogenase